VVEITGRSCSGKTHLLYHIAAMGVLPRAVGGQEAAVVVLDADGRFDVSRLAQIMRSHIQDSTLLRSARDDPTTSVTAATAATSGSASWDPGTSETRQCDAADALIRASLVHVHVFRPQSAASLLATVESIPAYLLAQPSGKTTRPAMPLPPQHYSANRRLHAILLDSASAFYWQDRYDQQEQQQQQQQQQPEWGPPGQQNGSGGGLPRRWRQPLSHAQRILLALRAVQSRFMLAPMVFYTTWQLHQFTPSAVSSAFAPTLTIHLE
jgi:hypothetical protein